MVRPVLALVLLGVLPRPAADDGIMLIQAGAFWMGRDDGAADEAPRHRVYVRDFWIERHKVTNAEFAAFLNAHGITSAEGARRIHLVPAAEQHAGWVTDRGYERHPVVEVSWFGARDFCARRRFPWGDAPPTPAHAVFGRRYNATEPTEARPGGASPYDVHDMLGNLREWTATMLKPYPYRHDDGREPFTGAGSVVVRGASHDDDADTLSITTRRSYDRRGAAAGHHHVGFRCATSEDLGGR